MNKKNEFIVEVKYMISLKFNQSNKEFYQPSSAICKLVVSLFKYIFNIFNFQSFIF